MVGLELRIPSREPLSQGMLPFEMERVSDGMEDNESTEAAMDEFQEGSLDAIKSAEYSQQRDIYTQNKPRKKKKSTERESIQYISWELGIWLSCPFFYCGIPDYMDLRGRGEGKEGVRERWEGREGWGRGRREEGGERREGWGGGRPLLRVVVLLECDHEECPPLMHYLLPTGPSRKVMEEYQRQAGGQPNSSDAQQMAPPASSPMGMMQIPGRRVRGNYPGLDLVHGAGGVADSTFEATVLGELAVISIEQEVSACCV